MNNFTKFLSRLDKTLQLKVETGYRAEKSKLSNFLSLSNLSTVFPEKISDPLVLMRSISLPIDIDNTNISLRIAEDGNSSLISFGFIYHDISNVMDGLKIICCSFSVSSDTLFKRNVYMNEEYDVNYSKAVEFILSEDFEKIIFPNGSPRYTKKGIQDFDSQNHKGFAENDIDIKKLEEKAHEFGRYRFQEDFRNFLHK